MKVTITADAYAITSAINAKEIETLKKHNPGALKVVDEDGNEKFAVSYNPGKPSITAFGITFGGKTHDEAGLLTLTGMIPAGTKDPVEFVADLVAPIKTYLESIEATARDAAKAALENRAALIESIKVC